VKNQIADWYKVDVSFDGVSGKEKFNGQIDKSLTLSQVLHGLQQPHLNFILTDNHVLVKSR
jgi:transmembrane sensor